MYIGPNTSDTSFSSIPAVVLVEPQLGENIGATARAMKNFGLRELRLVAPRDGWPNRKAIAMASGATGILEEAKVFQDTSEAVADLQCVFATTARLRELPKPLLSPRTAAEKLRMCERQAVRSGLIFGGERSGLSNEVLLGAECLISIPAEPSFRSLNLAQAVLLIAYEWWLATNGAPGEILPPELVRGAEHSEVTHLLDHLVAELDSVEFFRPPEKRPASLAVLRNLFYRVRITDSEVRMLRGVVHALARRPRRSTSDEQQ